MAGDRGVYETVTTSVLHWRNGTLRHRYSGERYANSLVGAGSDAQDFFVGGYLAGVFSQNVERWEALVTELVGCGVDKRLVMHLIWRSGMSPRIAEPISSWAREHAICPDELGLFT